MHVRQDDPTNPAVAPLLNAHVAEQRANTPPGFSFALDAGGLAAPDVTFWSAWHGDACVGMGALRALGPDDPTGRRPRPDGPGPPVARLSGCRREN